MRVKQQQSYPLLDKMMAFEDGSLGRDEMIELFQHLVNTGQAWTLQGFYGRTAAALIQAGYISAPRKTPSRGVVAPAAPHPRQRGDHDGDEALGR